MLDCSAPDVSPPPQPARYTGGMLVCERSNFLGDNVGLDLGFSAATGAWSAASLACPAADPSA